MVKVISLSNEAYEKLKMLKNGKSFSEVVIELTERKSKGNLMDFFGIWAGEKEKIERMKAMIGEDRKKFKLREADLFR